MPLLGDRRSGFAAVLAILIGATSIGLWATVLETRELSLPAALRPAARIKYERGQFLLIHRAYTRTPGPADHSVAVLDENGGELFNRNPGFDLPNVGMINVRDTTVTKDGYLVVAAYAWASPTGGPGGASVLMVYRLASGELVRVIRANPVACGLVAADEANNLWCFGPHIEKRQEKQDYNLVHKYSLDGQLLGEYLPRSLFANAGHTGPQPYEPFQSGNGGVPQLLAGPDGKVRAWLPNAHELVEWDSQGRLLGRTRLPGPPLGQGTGDASRLCSLAAMPDGTLLALLPVPQGGPTAGFPSGLYRLNRSSGEWDLVGSEWATPYPPPRLVGADASGLVLWNQAEARFVWLTLPK